MDDDSEVYRVIVAEDEPMIQREASCRDRSSEVASRLHGGRRGAQRPSRPSISPRSSHPDLLVTDIRMPVMDGLELIERCYRFHPSSWPSIIVSGYGDFAYAKAALRFGVRDYIVKPVENGDLSAALSRVWQRLSRADEDFSSEEPLPEGGARGELAERAAEALRELYKEHPSINALAERLRVNPAYLTRAFKEAFGVSPGRYVLDLRVSYARKLLEEEPDREVKEIAAELGYSDQCYFSRAFKRIVGVSPLEYRAARQR